MKFAILIITHTSPLQTKRIIEKLNNGHFDFYIHVDKKINIDTHKQLLTIKNVYFIENRIDVKWGGYSAIEATLSGIRQIVASGIKYECINLISGQDYPIKSAGYIADFLSEHKGSEFILYRKMYAEWQVGCKRVEKYHFTDFNFSGKYVLENTINFLTPKRKFPIKMQLYGKEAYWTLSLDCAKYIADFIDTNPKLNRFMKLTWGSDEFIFHSIILNSPYAPKVVNKNYRFMVWPEGSPRPKVLLTEDFEKIIASDALFARKFDINIDEKILDLIDEHNK